MFTAFIGDNSFVLHVAFVSNKNHLRIVPAVSFYLSHPLIKHLKQGIWYFYNIQNNNIQNLKNAELIKNHNLTANGIDKNWEGWVAR